MNCGRCPCPDRCRGLEAYCLWAAEEPADPVKLRHICDASGRREYPEVTTMVGAALAAAGRFVGAVATGGPVLVPAEVLETRRAACASCPKFVAEADRCELCGCYLRIKRTLATESCPLPDPKWRAIHGDDRTDDRTGP